jgi:hypothetical protein
MNVKITTLPSSLEIIEQNAFAFCNQISVDEFPESVTTIGT